MQAEDQGRLLRVLTGTLAEALTVDDVTRAALTAAVELDGVVRAGLALRKGAGRELSFVSTDNESLAPGRVTWCSIDGFADVPVTRAMRLGRTVCIPDLATMAEDFGVFAERQGSLGVRGMAAIPLGDGTDWFGAVMLSYEAEHRFTRRERTFFGAVSTVLTQAIRRGEAYQLQHSTAERLQRSLLPRSLPELEGLAFGAFYRPGGVGVDVGGDWYDVLELSDGSVLVSLGDVMGKGIPAAVVMSEVRAAMRAYALLDPSPDVVMARLDRLVTTLAVPEQIVTVVYGLFAPDRCTVSLAVAGHPPPLLVPSSGAPVVLDRFSGPALGLGAGPWHARRLAVEPGTALLFYSDGLVERRTQDLFQGVNDLSSTIEGLAARRRNPRELAARLGQLADPVSIEDDVTLIATAVTSSLPPRSDAIELTPDERAAGLARRFLRQTLDEWEVHGELVHTAELCVSELVTNSVIHSGTPCTVTARLDEEYLIVLVHDHGGAGIVHQFDDYEPMSVSGRGLRIVDTVSTAWSAEHSADGTTVWFELELEPSSADANGAQDHEQEDAGRV